MHSINTVGMLVAVLAVFRSTAATSAVSRELEEACTFATSLPSRGTLSIISLRVRRRAREPPATTANCSVAALAV